MSKTLREFIDMPGKIIDVRTPAEFIQGCIPGSFNLPLFSNDERVVVGTIYKQNGREAAVDEGFRRVGPRMADIAIDAKKITAGETAKVLCWRGGMRSAAVAWILKMSGLEAITLEGGYKTFRRWSLKTLESLSEANIKVIGGLTGTGKTQLLRKLALKGEQVLDLEGFANHRGSSFGGLGLVGQPTNEQFENIIAWNLKDLDIKKPLWVEDESILIGRCKIPDALFMKMKSSPLYLIEKTKEERLEQLCSEYASYPVHELVECALRIEKRLGGMLTKEVVEQLKSHEIKKAFELLLFYYDKTYEKGIGERNVIQKLNCIGLLDREIINRLITY